MQDDGLSKQQRTRRRLLGFAMELFARQGYPATTAVEIATAAGVSRATFFLHFPTKAALMGELSRALADIWSKEPALANETPIATIRRYLTFLCREIDVEASRSVPTLTSLHFDFMETYGTDMTVGIGEGTMHEVAVHLIQRAQAEGSWTSSLSAVTLGHVMLTTFNLVRAELPGESPTKAADALLALLRFGSQDGCVADIAKRFGGCD